MQLYLVKKWACCLQICNIKSYNLLALKSKMLKHYKNINRTLIILLCALWVFLHPTEGKKKMLFLCLGGIEPILRGIIGTAAAASSDMVMTEELTERLVVLNVPQHMDLAALNLQRGRDHALPGKCWAESQCHPANPVKSECRSSMFSQS